MSRAKQLVDRLVDLLLDKGVPLMLLASNIKELNYEQITMTKTENSIVVHMQCRDLAYPETVLTFRYTYNLEGCLIRREQLTPTGDEILWDRYEAIREILTDLAACSDASIEQETRRAIAEVATPAERETLLSFVA